MDLNTAGLLLIGKYQQSDSYAESGHILSGGKVDNLGETALRLNCFGHGMTKAIHIGNSANNSDIISAQIPDDGCKLVLGLGPTSSSYSHIGGIRNKEVPVLPSQLLTSDGDSGMLTLGLSGGNEPYPCMHEYSSSVTESVPSFIQDQLPSEKRMHIPVDEGSTSAKRSGGYMPSLLLAPRPGNSTNLPDTRELGSGNSNHRTLRSSPEPSATTAADFSGSLTSETTKAGGSSAHRSHRPKKCRFNGCSKGARGASGLCIAHGGGQRCQKLGCNKGAESRTAFCKAHGGGRRCLHLGCTKSAEGKTDYCIAHGGGRRCGHPDCTKAARGKSGLCIRHGGGKRCKVEGCNRSAEGQAGLCISHGGGRRCQYPECTKGAQGSTMYCKAHGGGKRCVFAGCTKGAEGSTPLCKAHGGGRRCLFDGGGICPKSVHGGTNFCVAHGGGKRCAVPGCSKSARGRTDCCVRHGGGKRCRFENCEKSAQGSTDFCKAHGGGKRCSWGQGACEKFARGKSGLCAAHSSMVQDRNASKGCMISAGLFRGLVPVSTVGSSLENDSSSVMSAVSDCIESAENTGSKQLIPPQVLVPWSMKTSSSGLLAVESREAEGSEGSLENRSFGFVVPEGRVHGGVLMSLLGGNLKNAIDGVM